MKNYALFIGTKLLAEVDELPKGTFLTPSLNVYCRRRGWGTIGMTPTKFEVPFFNRMEEFEITPEMRAIALLLGGS